MWLDTECIFIKLTLGNTVTVMSPDGKPIQINASSLQAATAQNSMGMITILELSCLDNCSQDCQWDAWNSVILSQVAIHNYF